MSRELWVSLYRSTLRSVRVYDNEPWKRAFLVHNKSLRAHLPNAGTNEMVKFFLGSHVAADILRHAYAYPNHPFPVTTLQREALLETVAREKKASENKSQEEQQKEIQQATDRAFALIRTLAQAKSDMQERLPGTMSPTVSSSGPNGFGAAFANNSSSDDDDDENDDDDVDVEYELEVMGSDNNDVDDEEGFSVFGQDDDDGPVIISPKLRQTLRKLGVDLHSIPNELVVPDGAQNKYRVIIKYDSGMSLEVVRDKVLYTKGTKHASRIMRKLAQTGAEFVVIDNDLYQHHKSQTDDDAPLPTTSQLSRDVASLDDDDDDKKEKESEPMHHDETDYYALSNSDNDVDSTTYKEYDHKDDTDGTSAFDPQEYGREEALRDLEHCLQHNCVHHLRRVLSVLGPEDLDEMTCTQLLANCHRKENVDLIVPLLAAVAANGFELSTEDVANLSAILRFKEDDTAGLLLLNHTLWKRCVTCLPSEQAQREGTSDDSRSTDAVNSSGFGTIGSFHHGTINNEHEDGARTIELEKQLNPFFSVPAPPTPFTSILKRNIPLLTNIVECCEDADITYGVADFVRQVGLQPTLPLLAHLVRTSTTNVLAQFSRTDSTKGIDPLVAKLATRETQRVLPVFSLAASYPDFAERDSQSMTIGIMFTALRSNNVSDRIEEGFKLLTLFNKGFQIPIHANLFRTFIYGLLEADDQLDRIDRAFLKRCRTFGTVPKDVRDIIKAYDKTNSKKKRQQQEQQQQHIL